MKISFSPTKCRFREEVRDWLQSNVPREKRPLDGKDCVAFDLAWQRTQYDGGWAGISWPAAYSGRGLTLVQQIIWYEEYARAKAPWIGVCFVGINHGGPTLIQCGSEEQKRFHLPQILRGEKIWCQGFSEPGAGSDLAGISTRARIEGDDLVVNGSKIWTSFAPHADYQELLLRTDPTATKHKGLSWVICDMKSPGITIRPIRMMSGEVDLAQVFYDDVRIPLQNIVGGLDKGWQVAMSTLGFERGTGFISEQVALAAQVEGLLVRAQDESDETGRPLIHNGHLAEDLAQLRAEVTALRAMTYHNVALAEKSGVPGAEASIIRLFTSELGRRVARLAIRLRGSSILDFHYGDDGDVHDYFYGFASTIAGSSSQIQRNIIGERILGLPKAS